MLEYAYTVTPEETFSILEDTSHIKKVFISLLFISRIQLKQNWISFSYKDPYYLFTD